MLYLSRLRLTRHTVALIFSRVRVLPSLQPYQVSYNLNPLTPNPKIT